MIKIYGSPRSSASRCYFLMEEIGLPYENVPLDMMNLREHKAAEYLRLNPNGKVPCLVDGDFVIWESLAINFYLAEKYKPELLGSDPQEKGLIHQWSLWGLTELQPPLIDMFIQLMFTPEDKRDPNVMKKAQDKLPIVFAILDRALTGKRHIVGDRFTLADLNLASVVNIASAVQVSLEPYPAIVAWNARIWERPAFQKLMKARKG